MKKLAFLIISALLLFACEKQPEFKSEDLVGEWHHHSGYEDGSVADVYVAFERDGSFRLYQLIGEGRYTFYSGSWSFEGGLLSGTYEDGCAWASSYRVEFLQDALLLRCSLHPEEEYLYLACTIPTDLVIY